MNPYYVIIGAVISAIFWLSQWEGQSAPSSSPPLGLSKGKRSQPPPIEVTALAPLREYEKMSTDELHQELGTWLGSECSWEGLIDDVEPSIQLLLIELARRDPESLLKWAWTQTDSNSSPNRPWYRVFKIVSTEWANNAPEDLIQFINEHANFETDFLSPNRPTGMHIDLHHLTPVSLGLSKSHPKISLQLSFISTLSGTTSFTDRMSLYQNPSEFELALSAWEEIDPRLTGKIRDELEITERNPNFHDWVQILIKRWKESDPVSFANSRFTAWEKEPDYRPHSDEVLKQVSPEYLDRFTFISKEIHHYRKLKYENPEVNLGKMNLSESQLRVWKDFEFLEQIKQGTVPLR